MIEKKILSQKIKEFQIKEFIAEEFEKTGYSHTKIQRTPLGDKITIYTSRPGLVVGRKGQNINRLTAILKRRFNMENPQIEIGEIENPYFDAQSISEKIAYALEKFGPKHFKSISYKTLQSIMDAGALGAEIVVSGKVPSSRAKSWRFMNGYLKKSGDIAVSKVVKGLAVAITKSGVIGIKVKIMPPTVDLPDKIDITPKKEEKIIEKLPEKVPVEEIKEEKEETKEEIKEKPKPKTRKKKVEDEKTKGFSKSK
mgnify:CR=1 FL=1